MQIVDYILGEQDTNCYLAWCEKTLEAIVIDPADSGDFISEKILESGLHLQAVILTHGHFDHCLGLLELQLNFDPQILMAEADLFLLEKAADSAAHWLKRTVDPIPFPTGFIEDGGSVSFGEEKLKVIATPGHTPGSICLHNSEVVFSGDTLFQGSIGRTDFKYSDKEKMQSSLEKLLKLPENTKVYPGHGELTTIKAEISNLQ